MKYETETATVAERIAPIETAKATGYALYRLLATWAIGLLFAALLAAPFFMPSEMIIDVRRLEYIPKGGVITDNVRARRNVVLMDYTSKIPMNLHWTSVVKRVLIADSPEQQIYLVTQCTGHGRWTYYEANSPEIIPFGNWAKDCVLAKDTYQLYIQWTASWLLWTWTVEARSGFFDYDPDA